jgi:hypothetical protein
MQLDFFSDNSEISLLRQEVSMYKASSDRVRKSVHAKLDACLKLICALQDEVKELKEKSQSVSHELKIVPDRKAM